MPTINKIFARLFFVALLAIENALACNGLEEPEIKEVIAAAKELAEFVSDDKKFPAIKNMSSEDQKAANAQAAMQPIDFTEAKHRIDRYALGSMVIESNVKGGTQELNGSAYKISRSCIVTAAHVLYPTTNQEMSKTNREIFNGKIKFAVGEGAERKEMTASVFFQMTDSGDYSIRDGERHFKGNSDIVILKLDNYEDKYFKPIKVLTSEELLFGVDKKIGRKIICMGSPSHMTKKMFGACSGANFKWKQENARIFEEDTYTTRLGVRSNLASSPGMSGGACFLAQDTSQLISIVTSGYSTDKNGQFEMPNINFESTDTAEKNGRYIATFDLLDKRMKTELGYGLKDLDKHCK